MSRRNRTREERARRNLWIAYLIWAVCVIAVMLCSIFDAEEPQAEPEPEPPVEVELSHEVAKPVEEPDVLTEEEVETILMEDELIEEALIEQGYYRDDIPLTYLEQDFLHTACDEFGIDYYVMVALVERETDFRNITGDKGNAYGYGQIWPKWWSGLMVEIGAENLMNPYDNFRTACAILAKHQTRYGDIENALTAYNTGKPGKSEYASDVLAAAEKWREGHKEDVIEQTR